MRKLFLITGWLFLGHANAQNLSPENGDTARAEAEISSATVFFGYGAELTHEAKIKTSTSTKIIVISRLSTSIDVNSLQVSCPEDVAILSQQYNLFYPVTPAPVKSKEAERMEDSIELVQKDIGRISNNMAIEQETLTKTGLLIGKTFTRQRAQQFENKRQQQPANFYLRDHIKEQQTDRLQPVAERSIPLIDH